jgi:hypothetical protein
MWLKVSSITAPGGSEQLTFAGLPRSATPLFSAVPLQAGIRARCHDDGLGHEHHPADPLRAEDAGAVDGDRRCGVVGEEQIRSQRRHDALPASPGNEQVTNAGASPSLPRPSRPRAQRACEGGQCALAWAAAFWWYSRLMTSACAVCAYAPIAPASNAPATTWQVAFIACPPDRHGNGGRQDRPIPGPVAHFAASRSLRG